MTTLREYDSFNRLRLIESRTNGVLVCSFTYDYSPANQRTCATAAPEATRWDYTCDALGQVTSGLKRWSDSTLVAGAQFNYSFHSIGNRLWTETGGDAAGTGLRHAAYTNNLLNQITAGDVPGAADLTGSAHPQAAVTVNGLTASRHSDHYHQVVTWNNATEAVWAPVTNRAQYQGLEDTTTGHVLLPRTPETFTHRRARKLAAGPQGSGGGAPGRSAPALLGGAVGACPRAKCRSFGRKVWGRKMGKSGLGFAPVECCLQDRFLPIPGSSWQLG